MEETRGPQKMRIGTTRSGRPGFFTGNYLSWNLSDDEYAMLKDNRAAQLAYVTARGFTLYPEE